MDAKLEKNLTFVKDNLKENRKILKGQLERKVIEVKIKNITDITEISLRTLVKDLSEELIELESTGFSDIVIVCDSTYCYDDSYNEYFLSGKRLENDSEYNKRLEQLIKAIKKAK